MTYRYDKRTEIEFIKQIRNDSKEEKEILEKWLDIIEAQTGKRPLFKNNGCDPGGSLLESKNVSAEPDYIVQGFGFVEIKFSRPRLKRYFHLKESQVKQYLKKETSILLVNSLSDAPEFTIVRPNSLKKIAEECMIVPWAGFGGKPSYRVNLNRFIWRAFK